VSAQYIHGHHESVLIAHRRRTAANSAAYLLEHLGPGNSLLDVGSGAGTITADLAGLVAPGQVWAVERTWSALDLTMAETAARGRGNVTGVVADAAALPFAARAVDVVHAHQVAQHLAGPVDALTEWRRVCAADGVVAVRDADYAAFTWGPELPELDRWRQLYLAEARASGGEPNAGRHLAGWAKAAGFSQVEVTTSEWRYAEPAQRAAWGLTWAERTEESAFAQRVVDSGRATPAELAQIATAWRTWAATDDAWFVVPHTEILARP